MNKFKIAVIPGDGIGKEVIPEGIKILETSKYPHLIYLFYGMSITGVANIMQKQEK